MAVVTWFSITILKLATLGSDAEIIALLLPHSIHIIESFLSLVSDLDLRLQIPRFTDLKIGDLKPILTLFLKESTGKISFIDANYTIDR